jgi:large subunit ribosomal protein L25
MVVKLEAIKRETSKSARASLRKEAMIPAVVYGKKEASTPIAVSVINFKKVWEEAGESTVVTLDGLGKGIDVLIQEVSIDHISGLPVHVDFYAIEADKMVEVEVPLEYVGEAPAVKLLGGNLVKVLHEVSIEALPKNLPHSIEVDISTLETFESQILAKDLKLSTGVTLITNAEEVVALVAAVTEEKDEDAVAPDLSTIEVIKEGKTDEESDAKADE